MTVSLAVRRSVQTLTRFRNGGAVLRGLIGQRFLGRDADLVFEVDARTSIRCPNVPGARVPVYEVFAEDAYRLGWFTAGLDEPLGALDIGGHIGCFSTALARARPDARITTYEASPTTFEYLADNIARNGLSDRVTVHNTAVSARDGVLSFADNGAGSGLNGLTAPAGSTAIEVPCTTFAAALASSEDRVGLVKIDTEGAEFDIVLNSTPADWSTVDRVVLEHHPVPGQTWTALVDLLREAGLDVVRHDQVAAELGTIWLSRTPI